MKTWHIYPGIHFFFFALLINRQEKEKKIKWFKGTIMLYHVSVGLTRQSNRQQTDHIFFFKRRILYGHERRTSLPLKKNLSAIRRS